VELALGSPAAAIVLAGVYAIGRWLDTSRVDEGTWSRRKWVSAAAGVSVAYVFMDVLPELAAQNRTIVAASGGESVLFAEQRIYVLALVAFVVVYGLEYVVFASRETRRAKTAAGETVIDGIYALHLSGYAAYSALIGYLLVDRAERGVQVLAVYTFAMALHFLIVDHSLREEHGAKYTNVGRWLLVASVLAGWSIGFVTSLSDVVFARLFAVLAGGVVITSLRAELPDERRGRFWPFVLGAAAFGSVLLFA